MDSLNVDLETPSPSPSDDSLEMISTKNDRTWPLRIVACDLERCPNKDITILVRGDCRIGTVMSKISEKLDSIIDLSDHALWWPEKKKWLKDFKKTLDQLSVYSTSELKFTSMHKSIQIQTPDLEVTKFNVDFSVKVLTAVENLCNELQISHPEEWSLAIPLKSTHLKRNSPTVQIDTTQSGTLDKNGKSPAMSPVNSNGTLNRSNGSTLNISQRTISSNGSLNGSSNSLSSIDSRNILLRPKTSVEKARLNTAWLDSSLSLYEQGITDEAFLLLKFKFFTFYNLNRNETTRINYIYEQLKWAVLYEEISCTEDEMYTLAAINYQVTRCSGQWSSGNQNGINNTNGADYLTCPSNNNYLNYANQNGRNGAHFPKHNGFTKGNLNGANGHPIENIDEVDCALENLEKHLEVVEIDPNRKCNGKIYKEQTIPKLVDKLKITLNRKKNFSTLNSTLHRLKLPNEKTFYGTFYETTLEAYKTTDFNISESIPKGPFTIQLNLNNCEVIPKVSISQQKYCFQILEHSKDEYREYNIKCRDEKQYAQWFTACKQASLGRTMAHAKYDEERTRTLKFLEIQSQASTISHLDKKELENCNIQIRDLVSPRFVKRKPKEQIIAKIKSIHSNFQNLKLNEAQMVFINTCQQLKDYGITLFVVRLSKSKKEELMGVSPEKIMLIEINTGSLMKSWKYRSLIDWNINWDVKKMQINFHDDCIEFECLTASCKVIHEFIGGYIYMSMRNPEHHQLDEKQFLMLTGGQLDNDEDNDEDKKIMWY